MSFLGSNYQFQLKIAVMILAFVYHTIVKFCWRQTTENYSLHINYEAITDVHNLPVNIQKLLWLSESLIIM